MEEAAPDATCFAKVSDLVLEACVDPFTSRDIGPRDGDTTSNECGSNVGSLGIVAKVIRTLSNSSR